MDNITAIESGHYGVLESLGGLKNLVGHGRKLWAYSYTLSTDWQTVLWDNPNRIAAIFTNNGTLVNELSVAGGATETFAILWPRGTFQIDKDFPWTGKVMASSTGATYLHVVEISL